MKDSKMPLKAWAIVERATGRLVLFDARVPLFWNRSVARRVAFEQGFEDTYGRDAEFEIKRVEVRTAK